MGITDIIFDLGGVVLTDDWYKDDSQAIAEFEKTFGVPAKNLQNAWDNTWPLIRIGQITEEAFWKRFLKIANANTTDIYRAKKLWRKYQHPTENMLKLLKKLKTYHRLSALSDTAKEWLDYKKQTWRLDDYFYKIVSSDKEHTGKPDPKIYQILVQKLQVSPASCLFIDDKEINLGPAAELGMHTILFISPADLETKLKQMNIVF